MAVELASLGQKLSVNVPEMRFLRDATKAYKDWIVALKATRIDEGEAQVHELKQLIVSAETIPIDLSEELDLLKQATQIYCICRQVNDGQFMIQCEGCTEWSHGRCMGLEAGVAEPQFLCPLCAAEHLMQHRLLIAHNATQLVMQLVAAESEAAMRGSAAPPPPPPLGGVMPGASGMPPAVAFGFAGGVPPPPPPPPPPPTTAAPAAVVAAAVAADAAAAAAAAGAAGAAATAAAVPSAPANANAGVGSPIVLEVYQWMIRVQPILVNAVATHAVWRTEWSKGGAGWLRSDLASTLKPGMVEWESQALVDVRLTLSPSKDALALLIDAENLVHKADAEGGPPIKGLIQSVTQAMKTVAWVRCALGVLDLTYRPTLNEVHTLVELTRDIPLSDEVRVCVSAVYPPGRGALLLSPLSLSR